MQFTLWPAAIREHCRCDPAHTLSSDVCCSNRRITCFISTHLDEHIYTLAQHLHASRHLVKCGNVRRPLSDAHWLPSNTWQLHRKHAGLRLLTLARTQIVERDASTNDGRAGHRPSATSTRWTNSP